MTALTIKNIPDELYEALKVAAEQHHRSINSEVIVRLKQLLLPRQITVEEKLTNIRRLRAQVKAGGITPEDIDAAINSGRP